MSSAAVLERIRRLREHNKRQARAQLAEALDRRLQHETQQANREADMVAVRNGATAHDTAHLALSHVYLLHQELGRRQAAVQLDRLTDLEARARHRLENALREEQTVEKLLERRREEAQRESQRQETAQLDEHAGRRWWRRNL